MNRQIDRERELVRNKEKELCVPFSNIKRKRDRKIDREGDRQRKRYL